MKELEQRITENEIIQEFKAENSSKMSRDDLEFYFFNFIAYDKEKASAIIMQCLAYDWEIIDAQTLCSIYPPQKVLAVYNPKIESRKKTLRKYIKQLENNEISFRERSYFDERTHFFCHVINGVSKYFETFEQLAEDLHNDLSNCNLSKALLPCVDFSKYITNDKTKLPISYEHTTLQVFNKKISYRTFQCIISLRQQLQKQKGRVIPITIKLIYTNKEEPDW